MVDVLESSGYLALGSRLKRMAERLQTDAGRLHADLGFPMQPGQYALLAALDARGALSVGETAQAIGASQPAVTRTHGALQKLGLTHVLATDGDQRQTRIALTVAGEKLVARMSREIWPHINAAAAAMCAGPDADMPTLLARLENAQATKSLETRVRAAAPGFSDRLSLVEWRDDLAGYFHDITRAWVEDMFVLEPNDIAIIENPRKLIIERGGSIIFVSDRQLGIIGTCALMPISDTCYELTKMGVTAQARGLNAGHFLMEKTLERAEALAMDELFLMTNNRCEAAIHLYEKYGFIHDENIKARFSDRYARAEVFMSYPRLSARPTN